MHGVISYQHHHMSTSTEGYDTATNSQLENNQQHVYLGYCCVHIHSCTHNGMHVSGSVTMPFCAQSYLTLDTIPGSGLCDHVLL